MKRIKALAILTLLSLLFPLSTKLVSAANYGSGTYGSGYYGEDEIVTTDSSSTAVDSTTTCGFQPPGPRPPWLYKAVAQDSSSILLYFSEGDNPISKYVLEYGTLSLSGNYEYKVDDMGINYRGNMTYLVRSLSPSTTYYFRVRGENFCAPGPWSDKIFATTRNLFSFSQFTAHAGESPTQTQFDITPTQTELKTIREGELTEEFEDGEEAEDTEGQSEIEEAARARSARVKITALGVAGVGIIILVIIILIALLAKSKKNT